MLPLLAAAIPSVISAGVNLIGANQSKKAGQFTPPPAPRPVDPGEAMGSYITAVTNPALQGNIIGAEGTYRPQYMGLSQRDLQNAMLGVAPGTEGGFYGTLDLLGMSSDRMAELNQRLATQNTQFVIDQTKAYGPAATAAYMAANPQAAAAMEAASALGGRQMSGYLNEMGRLAMQTPERMSINPFAAPGGSIYGDAQEQAQRALGAAQQNAMAGGQTAMAGQGVSPELQARMQGLVAGARAADAGGMPQVGMPGAVRADQVTSGGVLTPERVAAERVAAERVRAGQVQAGTIGAGALGESLYQQALQGQQLSPLSQALQQQGMARAATPGQLSPEEIRAATQGSREGYASSGRLMDNASITGEALARAGAARERSAQDIAMAQQINQQLLGAQQMGQQLATDVLRTDIQRQQANVGNQLQAGQFNVDAMLRGDLANQQTNLQANLANQDAFLRASLANQQAGMQAGQFNIQNAQDVQRLNQAANLQASLANQANQQRGYEFVTGTNLQAQLANRQFGLDELTARFNRLGQTTGVEQSMLNADRGYAQTLANMYSGITPAALNLAGLGQNAAAIGLGGMAYTAGTQAAGNVTPSLFNPDAGVNLALANAANQAGYNAAVAGAQGAAAGANATATAGLYGNLAKTAGNVAGNVNWGKILGGGG